jgi:hypothetical protein
VNRPRHLRRMTDRLRGSGAHHHLTWSSAFLKVPGCVVTEDPIRNLWYPSDLLM